MGAKNTLKKVGQAIVWPFVHLARALFSRTGLAAVKLAYREMAKTPLGAIIVPLVQKYATVDTLTNPEKFAAAFGDAINAAEAAKLAWKESLIRLGIELAVQALKNAW
jgi:hypothetical protein